jgi:AcrR family transcriptional regulator
MDRQSRKQETRERIRDAAARAIQREGLVAPNVAGVMAEAGLTVGGFYAHYENREALLLDALAGLFERRREAWLEPLSEADGAKRRHEAACTYLSRKHRDADGARCPLPQILGEVERADPRYRELLGTTIADWARALSGPDDDGRERALAAVATMVGGLTLARALGPTALSDQLLAAAKRAIAALDADADPR